jgi:hypothetical protein
MRQGAQYDKCVNLLYFRISAKLLYLSFGDPTQAQDARITRAL